jgi:hypothetical protein
LIDDWIPILQVAATIVQVAATIALVYYAAVTIREAQRDRRKKTVERMLERIYSPMVEIMMRARYDHAGRRAAVLREPTKDGHSRDYTFSFQEFDQLKRILERYGYYLGKEELDKLHFDLDSKKIEEVIWGTPPDAELWFRLLTDVFDIHTSFLEFQ